MQVRVVQRKAGAPKGALPPGLEEREAATAATTSPSSRDKKPGLATAGTDVKEGAVKLASAGLSTGKAGLDLGVKTGKAGFQLGKEGATKAGEGLGKAGRALGSSLSKMRLGGGFKSSQ